MSKRTRSETDDDSDPEFQADASSLLNESLVIAALIRLVLARLSKNLKIRKEHISQVIHSHNLKAHTRSIVTRLNSELKEVFGLSLEQLGNEMLVLSHLQDESRDALYELFDVQISSSSHLNLQDSLHILPSDKREPVLINSTEHVLGGLILLVVCLLVVNENRMRESDLIAALKNFGFTENLNVSVPSFSKTSPELIGEIIKRDYIQRTSLLSNKEGGGGDLALGKKALRELEPDAIYRFICEVFGGEDHNGKCLKSVVRCFPHFRIAEIESEGETRRSQRSDLETHGD